MEIKHYSDYTTEDFVLDEKFRKIIKSRLGSQKFLEKLIEKLPEKSEEIELAVRILHELKTEKHIHSFVYKQQAWQNICQQHKHYVRLQFLKYAAIFLLLLGMGSTTFFLMNRGQSLEDFAVLNKANYKDAALILSDGEKVDIHSKESKVQYTKNGRAVSVNDTTKFGQGNTDKGYNQLIVPYGKRSTLLLSDGTKVWLNSGSRLVYAPVFSGKYREVYLEGEGYFEVAKDADKPFFVKTDAIQIKVYGTKFDVQAYKSENEYNTLLVEGKVSMEVNQDLNAKEIFLTPNQKACLYKEQNEVLLSKVDNVENYIAWIDGYLPFENESITKLTKKISHYYNIDIDTKLAGNRIRISGKLDLKDDPEKVIATLAVITRTRYVKQGTKYLIYE